MLIFWLNTVFSAEDAPALATSSTSQMLTVIGALLLVIAAIYASVWGIKRLSHFGQQSEGQLKIVSGLMVGPKERVVLIDCAGKKLLLGVASGQVNLIHRLDDPCPSNKSEFESLLKKVESDD